jgi:ATP-dependent RNA helicase DHX29
MAPGKKKKKPIANPARGFATTSIVSKKAVESDAESSPADEVPAVVTLENQPADASATTAGLANTTSNLPKGNLTPAEFEKQLEESELQVLVEKHAQKSKRDAARQKIRLETDRRVLRGQAESLNTRKWLPPELMDEILELVKTEGRFSGQAADTSSVLKQSSEEELTIRLWTLQQSLVGAGFLEEKVVLALRHILEISDKVGTGNKDTIWGMEECLDWLARECSREELPDYDNPNRKIGLHPKSQTCQ